MTLSTNPFYMGLGFLLYKGHGISSEISCNLWML